MRSRPRAGPQCSPAGPGARREERGEGGGAGRPRLPGCPPPPEKMQMPGLPRSANLFSIPVVLCL